MTLPQTGLGGAQPAAPAVPAGLPTVRPATTVAEQKPSRLVSRILFLAALIFATIVFLFPFIWLVSASLKTRHFLIVSNVSRPPRPPLLGIRRSATRPRYRFNVWRLARSENRTVKLFVVRRSRE